MIAADREVDLALALHTHPRLARALRDGLLDKTQATQILTGASQKLFYDTAAGNKTLVIEATKFVTREIIDVWTGTKQGGDDPTGVYSRLSGLDPVATLTVEAV